MKHFALVALLFGWPNGCQFLSPTQVVEQTANEPHHGHDGDGTTTGAAQGFTCAPDDCTLGAGGSSCSTIAVSCADGQARAVACTCQDGSTGAGICNGASVNPQPGGAATTCTCTADGLSGECSPVQLGS